jgi:hypothetical protein
VALPEDRELGRLLLIAAALSIVAAAAGAAVRWAVLQRWPLAHASVLFVEWHPLVAGGPHVDPWGRPFVEIASTGGGYSCGPNGLDEGGAGDDLIVVITYVTLHLLDRTPRSFDEILITVVRHSSELAAQLGVLFFGGLAVAASMRRLARPTSVRRLTPRLLLGLPSSAAWALLGLRLGQGAAIDGALEPAHMVVSLPIAAALTGAAAAMAMFFALLCLADRALDRVRGEPPLDLP